MAARPSGSRASRTVPMEGSRVAQQPGRRQGDGQAGARRRRLAIGGPSTWNGGRSSGHRGVLVATLAGTVLGRSGGARPFATVCGAGVEPSISCMLAHGRGRWRPPVLRMAFKRSRVRLPSAPLLPFHFKRARRSNRRGRGRAEAVGPGDPEQNWRGADRRGSYGVVVVVLVLVV